MVKNFLKLLQCSVLQPFEKKSHYFKHSFKNLLTNKYINCNLRLMNDQLRPCESKGRIMKDESRSESQAEMGGAGLPAVAASSAVLSVVLTKEEAAAAKGNAAKVGKIRENPCCPTHLPSFHRAGNRGAQSSSVKAGQTDVRVLPHRQSRCNYFKMNNLQKSSSRPAKQC